LLLEYGLDAGVATVAAALWSGAVSAGGAELIQMGMNVVDVEKGCAT
jgi:hypothetical protein